MPRWQRPWQGLACIAGGFVMHLTLGTIYTFGNVTSYLTSYLHVRVSEDVDYATTMWIPALMNMGQGLTLAVGGRLYGRFGPRVACLIGCAVLTVSTALSSQTVRSSVALLSLTYGLGGGIGVGLAYVAPMSSAMKFYQLYVTFLFNTITIGFINPLWKAYGQKNIADDHFLAFVGSAAAVFNSLGRVMWGALCDRTSYRTAMLCACTLLCAAFATMQLTPLGGRWMFAVWVWLVFVSFSANFCLIVTAVANTYGTQHAGPIYGVIFSSSVIGSPISVGLANVFLQKLGFPVMFMIQASFVCVRLDMSNIH
ncbi:hypothetical protein FJT64_018557 [Amphibalanus amphitrite]|uniref:Uncharacterized protein n=1 Tax=Amphibalanus amphitrite TaxID=1232801 RepID=A0A6A4WUG4_AMPAM|nr:hypothetical protein FJT64_018557 [Amphibalanus amphitrite]